MIITKAPFRISFFGGGTDYPAWYRVHGGAVLAATIDKYCYLTCRYLPPFFDHRTRISYTLIELVKEFDEIKHPSVRECLKYMAIEKGVEIHHDGDLPARTGLGSSSSFTVALLQALYALKGRLVSNRQLAADAIHVEQDIIKENVGCQDQILAALGGFNLIEFDANPDFRVQPVTIAKERADLLAKHMLLVYTGQSRIASEIAGELIKQTAKRKTELTAIHQMVFEALKILYSNRELAEFGKLLNEAWKLKRSLTDRISNPLVDEIYETAMKNGATGGKLLGAGGGGFVLLFASPDRQEKLKEALRRFLFVPFGFESSGTQIIYYKRDEYE